MRRLSALVACTTFLSVAAAVGAASLLRPGAAMPAWSSVDHFGATVGADELAGSAYLLWFYPRAQTPGCTMEGRGLRDRADDLQAAGVTVLGVSFDTPEANARFAEAEDFPYRLLSDLDRSLALALGAATHRAQSAATRISYLVGPDGKILQIYEQVDPATHAATVLADARTLIGEDQSAARAIRAAVEAPDRAAADRALDEGRKPAALLTFAGIAPGMKVAEIAAGRGYTAELLARVVGTEGQVWGHNTPFILNRFAEEPWSARLEKKVMAPVVRVDRPFDDPLPDQARDLDAVLLILFYHDTYWMEIDRAAMNRDIFNALRPGGSYVVLDHSAAPGAGSSAVKTLHRVEESLVRREIEAAGFRLEAESQAWRNPDDARDWNAAPGASGDRRGTSDRFALRFVKSAEGE